MADMIQWEDKISKNETVTRTGILIQFITVREIPDNQQMSVWYENIYAMVRTGDGAYRQVPYDIIKWRNHT